MENKVFGEIKKEALEFWINFLNSPECDFCNWKNKHKGHCALYCNMMESVEHITDMLEEENQHIDNSILYYSDVNREIGEKIYRWYSRFLLVSSEILLDYVELNRHLLSKKEKIKDKKARRKSSDPNILFNIQDLIVFTNKISKHRTLGGSKKNALYYTHHNIFLSEDASNNIYQGMKEEQIAETFSLKYKNPSSKVKFVIFPRLIDVLKHIIYSHSLANNFIMNENHSEIYSKWIEGFIDYEFDRYDPLTKIYNKLLVNSNTE